MTAPRSLAAREAAAWREVAERCARTRSAHLEGVADCVINLRDNQVWARTHRRLIAHGYYSDMLSHGRLGVKPAVLAALWLAEEAAAGVAP